MAKEYGASESQLPIIPDHLIVDKILPRLPIKSLICFKSASKHWLFTISSHGFNKNRLKFSSNCNQGLILCKAWFLYNNFLSFDECLNVKEFTTLGSKYPSVNLLPKHSKAVGSCNGLVCLYDDYFRSFHLWNPATNQRRNADCPNDLLSVPPMPTRLMLRGESRTCNYFMGYGFGYVPSIDDYRIAGLWTCTKGLCHVYVFTLRAGTWNKMASFDEKNFYIRLGGEVGCMIEDTLYWPPIIHHNNHENHIVMLDLASGKLQKIPLMDSGISYNTGVKVFEMKGCLSFCCMNYINNCWEFRGYDVWMLKQLNDWNSWEKVLSFEDRPAGWPLHFLETGECLVRGGRDELILHRRPSEAAPEKYGEGNLIWEGYGKEEFFPYFNGALEYVESPIWPFGIPEMMPTLENE